MITDDQTWESLASEYLRRLASKDMQQWARYWKSEDRSTGPDAEPHVNASETISKRERDRRRLMRGLVGWYCACDGPFKAERSAGLNDQVLKRSNAV
jgi:hypothetical protein